MLWLIGITLGALALIATSLATVGVKSLLKSRWRTGLAHVLAALGMAAGASLLLAIGAAQLAAQVAVSDAAEQKAVFSAQILRLMTIALLGLPLGLVVGLFLNRRRERA
jgi:hypothetical protein